MSLASLSTHCLGFELDALTVRTRSHIVTQHITYPTQFYGKYQWDYAIVTFYQWLFLVFLLQTFVKT